MCLVSTKIKFCTCGEGAFEEDTYEDLPHYWLLHRYNKQKDLEIMGMPVMPLDFMQPNYLLNAQTLGERLNESDAFVFRYSGMKHPFALNLTLKQYLLLKKEYPLIIPYVKYHAKKDHYELRMEVNSMKPVGRMGIN